MPVTVKAPVTQCSLRCFVANYLQFWNTPTKHIRGVIGSFTFVQEKISLPYICILHKHDSRKMCGYEQNRMNIIRKAGGYGLANDIHHLDKTSSQDTFEKQQQRLGHFTMFKCQIVNISFTMK